VIATEDDKIPSPEQQGDATPPAADTLVGKANALAAKAALAGPKRRAAKKLTPQAFGNPQLNLFQDFLVNNDVERDNVSNMFDFWDSVPRYSVSSQHQTKMRSPDGNLKLLKHDFQYRGKKLRAIIQPAKIEVPDNEGKLVEMEFYPAASEELIEDALRKIAADQQQGFFDKDNYRSGVTFTLHQLREELAKRNKTRSLQEIKLSLTILAKSNIELVDLSGTGEGVAMSNFLPALVTTSRKDLDVDPEAKCVAQFHPLVTKSIDQLRYRQFNYARLLANKTQLARWLHRQLINKFVFASIGGEFEMKFSTIDRDSCMLSGYKETRLAVDAVDKAFAELTPDVLLSIKKDVKRGARMKILDVVYKVSPAPQFVREVKAASKRLSLAEEKLKVPKNGDQGDRF
jgi:hypothetical protein